MAERLKTGRFPKSISKGSVMIRIFATVMLIVSMTAASLSAQEIDTTAVKRIIYIESQIDSFRGTIRTLDKELQRVKLGMAEGPAYFDELLKQLSGEELEIAPADQYSRRKRVDTILKTVSERPGQLLFNGGTTAFVQGATNDESSGYTGVGALDIFAHTAFGAHTIFFIDMRAVGGNGSDTDFPTFSNLNGSAGSLQITDIGDPVRI
jgi:hypothetical protein